MRTISGWGIFVAGMALIVAACGGGGGDTPTSPSPGGGGGTGTGTGNTITITASGVSPRDVTVNQGDRVTFVNNDNRPHEMDSDPHPEHTDCPEISVGFIQAGQSRTTENLTRARTCRFHDHNQPSNTSLTGSITIR
jgi:plastocyanin